MDEKGRNNPLRELDSLLADEHVGVLDALDALLRHHGIQVVGVARTGAAALRLLRDRRPHLLVLDAELPDTSGLDLAREAERIDPAIRIVFYTAVAGPRLVDEVGRRAGRAIVLKQAPPAELIAAIEAVARGSNHVDPRLRSRPPDAQR